MKKKLKKVSKSRRTSILHTIKHKPVHAFSVIIVLSAVLFAIISFVSANIPKQVLADNSSVNFENPTYTIGSINGQDGWASTGSAGFGCAVYDQAVSSQSLYPTFGSQSFRISDAVTSGCFGDQTFAKPLQDSVGEAGATSGSFLVGNKQTHFEMQFNIASVTPNTQQPGLHVSVSPDRGDGSRMSYLRFEDNTNGIDVFFDDVQGTTNPANFVETQIGTGLDRTIPHTIKLTLDILDGPSNDVVKVWVDGNLVVTGTSWENYYRYDSEASAEQSPRIVKTVLFRSGGTAVPQHAGKGFYFDNLTTTSGPILVNPPTDKKQCKDGDWKTFNNPAFKNQGQCEDYVEKHAHDKKHDKDDDHNDRDGNNFRRKERNRHKD